MESSLVRSKHCIPKKNNSYKTSLLCFGCGCQPGLRKNSNIHCIHQKPYQRLLKYTSCLPCPSLFLALFLFFWGSWEMPRCPVHSPHCLLHAPPTNTTQRSSTAVSAYEQIWLHRIPLVETPFLCNIISGLHSAY